MKKYTSIGDLLKDYRDFNIITQADLAAKFDVDIRTISRWEKNKTLLKPDKEEDMVDITFIPYQVIRNLNAPVSIPTFYDFSLRKYSISEFSKELPDMNWLKSKTDLTTERLRKITHDSDLNDIIRCYQTQKNNSKNIDKKLILEATKLLPELNFILFDSSGYYSGHSVFLPLKRSVYTKIRMQTLKEEELTIDDLVDYKKESNPVFYSFDVNSDCNENLFYISSAIRFFFMALHKNYTYASYTSRYDTYELNLQLGTTMIWEEKITVESKTEKITARLYELNVTK